MRFGAVIWRQKQRKKGEEKKNVMDFISPATKMIHQDNVRMTGFLEKKGKMKLVSPWKKYWFVLEKRLLLYYRSEIEYANLSPCRGSLNMGLVTTVRPGSSSGPCVIHIVTRTQAMQLRAKNRAAQEEWLQALLHSMAVPVVPKNLKPPSMKRKYVGHTASLDNVSFSNGWKRCNQAAEDWSLPRRLNYRKRQISGSYYGGSLDTAIWTKKFRPIKTPTCGFPRARLVDKCLESPNESDSSSLVTSSQKELRHTALNDVRSRLTVNNSHSDDGIRRDGDRKCKVHDDDKLKRNSFSEFPYGLAERLKKAKAITNDETPFFDNLVKREETDRATKPDKKEESPFEKLKNALSRVPREKILRKKPDVERKASTKKRRQSFLQKVFKRMGHEGQEDGCESDISDYFYDVINPVQRFNGSTIKEENQIESDSTVNSKKTGESVIYAEVRKSVAGPKTVVPEPASLDLKLKTESQESLIEEGINLSENAGDKDTTGSNVEKEDTSSAPLLPPRRVSRPVSPWHDVPTNNAPVDSEKKISFFSHQAMVKFKEPPLPCMTLNELISNEVKSNASEPIKSTCENDLQLRDKNRNDDLSLLLEQLTKITVAPLEGGKSCEHVKQDARDSAGTKNFKPEIQDPDYDVPRPHKPLSVIVFGQNDPSPLIDLTACCNDNSDKSLSLHSMEPDSLDSISGKQVEI